MDISDTLAPKSDQLDAIDLIGGARTFTVKGVRRGNAEQPVQIDLAEFDRPWRPSKGMRRVLAAVWGRDASKWVGRRVRLFCDETVKFGGKPAPGIRIVAMDGLTEPKAIPLLATRGQYQLHDVMPLEPQPDTDAMTAALDDINGAQSMPALKAAWDLAGKRGVATVAAVVAAKDTRKAEINEGEQS
jgi:hypothetical protein